MTGTIFVSYEIPEGNYTLILTLRDFNLEDPAEKTYNIDLKVENKEFEYKVIAEKGLPTEADPPTFSINRISKKGEIEIEFSEKFVTTKVNSTMINRTALELEIIPAYAEQDMSMLNFTWNVTSFK